MSLKKVVLSVERLDERVVLSTYKKLNLAYGTDPAQILDIQSNTTYTSAPVVVLIHGGGWTTGNKTNPEGTYASYYLSQGFVVVAPNYRLVAPNGSGGYINQFPTAMDDVALAISWFQANAAQYGANPNKIVLQGASAGSQIAAMLAYDPTGFNNWGLAAPLTGIVGFVGDSGPYNWTYVLSVSQPIVQEFLGSYYGSPQWNPTEPVTYVHSGEVPSLIIAGTSDNIVGFQASVTFNQMMLTAGNKSTLQLYQGYSHTEFTHLFKTSSAEQAVLTSWLVGIGL